ncbi:ElaB/YqjD/DUF883 family membrane-anchored ribosome-binding protein [Agrobacterium vitis]|nr:ElaB/YqjD/DUF883 family membrane-anchored ribosome-binding protein [Agrobacterium vitis]MBE1436543.1 ElaB/YqjD/DUF883 family membrane-anchored ribosome-binding protein [Agrobacterium vitis]
MAATTPLAKDADKNDYASSADVEKQLEKLSADIAALTKVIASFGTGKLDEAQQQAKSVAEDISQRSSAAATDIKDRLLAAESDLEGQIRRYPLAAVGIAAGFGFIAALLSSRR